MKRIFCFMLAILMLTGAASAQILTTGSVNVRSGPGLEYDTIGSIAEDELVFYRHQTEVDGRGVEWHFIGYKKLNGWISSKYAKSLVGPVDEVSSKEISRYKEVAQYFDAEDVAKAAKKIGLEGYSYPYGEEGPSVHFDKSLLFGVKNMQYLRVTGPGYTIHGAAVGMKIEEAAQKLKKAGLVAANDDPDCGAFERIASEDSWFDEGEADSVIYLYENEGIVYMIDWEAYSG